MRKASQGSIVSTVGILICKWIPKMRKASQGSPVCMVGIRFVDPKNEESFSRKSCIYGSDLIFCSKQMVGVKSL